MPAQLLAEDFTESTNSVDRGVWQIEIGITWEEDNVLVFPEALARLGISERVELGFGLSSYVDTKGASGLSDASFGVKLELGSVAGGEMAVITEVSIPPGRR